MNILNVTHSNIWFQDHFKLLCEKTGHTGETFFLSEPCFTAERADAIWREHSDYFNSFDAVFVSHLSYWSRTFLQNGWEKPLYIWFNYKFDYTLRGDDLRAYHKLIKETRTKPNVKVFAASEANKLYAQRALDGLPLEIVPPIFCVNNESRMKVPCEDTLFLWGKHNETLFSEELRGLPIYRPGWTDWAPDLTGVKGIIHLPYVCDTRSFWENMALENVYLLPDENLLQQCQTRATYFWDSYGPGDIEASMWYREEHRKFFIYFSSFEELRAIVNSPDLNSLIAKKKQLLREFSQGYNTKTLEKWKQILGEQ